MNRLNPNTKMFSAIIKIIALAVIFVSILFPMIYSNQETKNLIIQVSAKEKPVIIIDAGHGGEDCGAIGVSGVFEKDLNLQISQKLSEYAKSAGYVVIQTREDDRLLYKDEENIKGFRKIYDLKNRVAIANSYENAIFVSIHMNSYGSEDCQGLHVYYSPKSSQSRRLADCVQSYVVSNLQQKNKRKIKEGSDIYVLENSNVPAILIECGFVSNPEECKKLSEKEYQKELSFSILCGIINYIDDESSLK
jgi:N-acetylmuramoyl-L-alanine amidase